MAVEVFRPDEGKSKAELKEVELKEVELKMTEQAVSHFKGQLADRDENAVRLSVKKSGCSGFMYEVDFVNAPNQEDQTFEFDEVVLHVSQEALPIVKGTEIDYVTEGVNSTLQFKNPNAKAMCGCGESFTL